MSNLFSSRKKQNRIANDLAAGIAGDKLFSLVGPVALDAVDTQIREQLQYVWNLNIEIGHIVRLVEQGTAFLPGTLFVCPVGKLRGNHWKGIGSDLRIAQRCYRAPGALYRIFHVVVTQSAIRPPVKRQDGTCSPISESGYRRNVLSIGPVGARDGRTWGCMGSGPSRSQRGRLRRIYSSQVLEGPETSHLSGRNQE